MDAKNHEWKTTRDNAVSLTSGFGNRQDYRVIHAGGWDVAYCPPTDDDNGNANARRIVACVNALAGIPTAALEAGAVAKLVEVVASLVQFHGNLGERLDSRSAAILIDNARAALVLVRGEG